MSKLKDLLIEYDDRGMSDYMHWYTFNCYDTTPEQQELEAYEQYARQVPETVRDRAECLRSFLQSLNETNTK